MTSGNFNGMTKQEQRDLARRLVEESDVLDFDSALRIARVDPAEAENVLRHIEQSKARDKELAESFRRLRLAAQEFR